MPCRFCLPCLHHVCLYISWYCISCLRFGCFTFLLPMLSLLSRWWPVTVACKNISPGYHMSLTPCPNHCCRRLPKMLWKNWIVAIFIASISHKPVGNHQSCLQVLKRRLHDLPPASIIRLKYSGRPWYSFILTDLGYEDVSTKVRESELLLG